MRAGGAALLALALLGCSRAGGGPATAAPTPAAGPRVVTPSGAVFSVELARTDEERAQGLMFRESLLPGWGMLFLFDEPEVRPFWMKNCHFPLDMVFALKDGTVVDVLRDVPPCAADPCPSYPPKGPADRVLEIAGGEASRNGIVPGSKLRYLDVPPR